MIYVHFAWFSIISSTLFFSVFPEQTERERLQHQYPPQCEWCLVLFTYATCLIGFRTAAWVIPEKLVPVLSSISSSVGCSLTATIQYLILYCLEHQRNYVLRSHFFWHWYLLPQRVEWLSPLLGLLKRNIVEGLSSILLVVSCQEMRTHSDLSLLLFFYFQAIQQAKTSTSDHQLPAHFCLHGLKKDLLFRWPVCLCVTPEDARRLVVADIFSQCTTFLLLKRILLDYQKHNGHWSFPNRITVSRISVF